MHRLLSLGSAQLELLETALELLLRKAHRLLFVGLQRVALHADLLLPGGRHHLVHGTGAWLWLRGGGGRVLVRVVLVKRVGLGLVLLLWVE